MSDPTSQLTFNEEYDLNNSIFPSTNGLRIEKQEQKIGFIVQTQIKGHHAYYPTANTNFVERVPLTIADLSTIQLKILQLDLEHEQH